METHPIDLVKQSVRNVKTELEFLREAKIITSNVLDQLLSALPAADNACHLLRLPVELREVIYAYLFPLKETEIYAKHYGRWGLHSAELVRTTVSNTQTDEAKKLRSHPAILRTCQQIYKEAKTPLSRIKRLHLMPPINRVGQPYYPAIEDVSRRRRPFDARLLRTIGYLEEITVTYRPDLNFHHALGSFFPDHLKTTLRVNTLSVYFQIEGSGSDECNDCLNEQLKSIAPWWKVASHTQEMVVDIRDLMMGYKMVTWKKVRSEEWQQQEIGAEDGPHLAEWVEARDNMFALFVQRYEEVMETIEQENSPKEST